VSETKDIAGMLAVVEHVDTDSVTFVATADNTKQNRVFQEGVHFTDISAMLSKRTVPSQ
jgi:predicted RNA-binding protein with PIN domain